MNTHYVEVYRVADICVISCPFVVDVHCTGLFVEYAVAFGTLLWHLFFELLIKRPGIMALFTL